MDISNRLEKMDALVKKIFKGVSIGLAMYYIYTGFFGTISPMWQMMPLLTIATILAFLEKPLSKNRPYGWLRLVDYALIMFSLIACLYLVSALERSLVVLGTSPTGWRLFFGWAIIIVTLDATRRVMGMSLPIFVVCFLLYGRWGNYMPSLLFSRGYQWDYIADSISLGFDGIFGMPLTVCGNIIVFYLIFAAFLREGGAMEFFNDAASSILGRFKGGPAKMSVVASGTFGTLSGSGVANVATTGAFTIPLMKSTGFSAISSAAVEALSSTGGQLMPPIMGAAAFLMSDMLGVPYWSVVTAAFLPAALYFFSLFMIVHFEACKLGLKGLTKDETPSVKQALSKAWILGLPLAVLIYELGIARVSTQRAALMALVVFFGASFISKRTRLNVRKISDAFEKGITTMTVVTLACASAGMAVGIVYLTNLGLSLTGLLIDVSGGSLLLLLILTAFTSLVLGLGLTTSACYLIVAILVAPALIKMGVLPMAAHLFVFYYAILEMVTPPVALSAFAAAGIAECSPMAAGWRAMWFGLIAYILPFMWVYHPALTLEGSIGQIMLAVVTSGLGIIGFAGAIQAYFIANANTLQRTILFVGGLLMISPGIRTDGIGLGLMAGVAVWQAVILLNRKNGNKDDDSK